MDKRTVLQLKEGNRQTERAHKRTAFREFQHRRPKLRTFRRGKEREKDHLISIKEGRIQKHATDIVKKLYLIR